MNSVFSIKNNNDEIMEKLLKRDCSVCGSNEGVVVHHQRFMIEQGNPLPNSYDVVVCSRCGFVFADVDCMQDDYDRYYKEFSKYENDYIAAGSGCMDYDYDRLSVVVDEIIKYVPDKTRKILDIGSAGGGLLGIFNEKGYQNLYALEPSTVCVNKISQKYDGRVVAAAGSVLGDIGSVFEGQKFDLVILSHVLEHVYDLGLAIKNIVSVLREDGMVYVEVPNLNGYVKYFKVPYHYFDVEHINHFNTKSIRDMCSVLGGLEPVFVGEKEIRVSESENYPAVYGIFKADHKGIRAVRDYVNISIEKDNLGVVISDLIESQIPVVIWGAGSYTKRVLATTGILRCNVNCIVDSEKNKQNKDIVGVPVLSPDVLSGFDGVIVVLSALYAEDIKSQIRRMNIKNKIIAV